MIKKDTSSKLFDICNHIFLLMLAISTIYPLWDLLMVSFMDLKQYMDSVVHLYPKRIILTSYKSMFQLSMLWTAYGNTIFITIVGTCINMLLTVMGGYAFSREGIKGQRVFMFLITFTMLFSGGLIPNYILVRKLGLMNTLWAVMIPISISTYNLILMRSYFRNVPKELEESAKIDGDNEVGILFRIFLPLSLPAVATISLFYAVGHWNQFFLAVMYLTDKKYITLQLFLRSMLYENEAAYQLGGDSVALLGQPLKAATVIISVIPIMLVYPFFQKQFTKGIMLGAVKG